MLWLLLPTAGADDCARIPRLLERLHQESCPTTALLQLSELQCDDPRLAPFARQPVAQMAPPPPVEGKGLRDGYSMPNSQESENFVVRWGASGNWPSSRADDVLDALEAAWSLILEDMDYVAPSGTDSYKFNVYIGDTGGPGAYGSAYYTRDGNNWPMIVVTPGTFSDPAWGTTVGAHEFFHALQDAANAPYLYTETSLGAWYWEATANWVETAIYPENRAQTVTGFLMGYAFLPHLPIHYFDYADGSGGLGEYHQYGAFIFPYFLTREIADDELIRSSWLEATSPDPLIELNELLQADWATDIDAAFFDFAASNVTWETYDDGDVFSAYIDAYQAHYGNHSDRIAAESGPDSGGWKDAPSSTLPQRYGTNHLVITPEGGDLLVSFTGDLTGSRGGEATWDVRAVLVEGDSGTTIPLPLTDGAGAMELSGSGTVDAVWLVVSVVSESTLDGEEFSWSYNIGELEGPESEPGTDTGDSSSPTPIGTIEPVTEVDCGCQQGTFIAWTLLLPLAWVRRRR